MGLFDLFASSGPRFGSVSLNNLRNIQSDWENIAILIRGSTPSQLRQALIAADKTLDAALRDIVDGESMGERLKNVRDLMDRDMYQKMWAAHRVRNNLVHEAGYEPPHYVVKSAIEDLRTVLHRLGVQV